MSGEGDSWWSVSNNLWNKAKETGSYVYEFTAKDLGEVAASLKQDVIVPSASALRHQIQPHAQYGSLSDSVATMLGSVSEYLAPDNEASITYISRYGEDRLAAIQTDPASYTDHVPDEHFTLWCADFKLDENTSEISQLLVNNSALRAVHTQLVPGDISYSNFWKVYYYRTALFYQEKRKHEELLARVEREEDEEEGWGDEEEEEEEVAGPSGQSAAATLDTDQSAAATLDTDQSADATLDTDQSADATLDTDQSAATTLDNNKPTAESATEASAVEDGQECTEEEASLSMTSSTSEPAELEQCQADTTGEQCQADTTGEHSDTGLEQSTPAVESSVDSIAPSLDSIAPSLESSTVLVELPDEETPDNSTEDVENETQADNAENECVTEVRTVEVSDTNEGDRPAGADLKGGDVDDEFEAELDAMMLDMKDEEAMGSEADDDDWEDWD